MTHDEWQRLFALNDRLTHLYAALQADVMDVEKTSGLSMIEAMVALEQFAVAMTKATEVLNDRLKEDRESFQRKEAVEDVLRSVRDQIRYKNKTRKKKYDDVREDRSTENE